MVVSSAVVVTPLLLNLMDPVEEAKAASAKKADKDKIYYITNKCAGCHQHRHSDKRTGLWSLHGRRRHLWQLHSTSGRRVWRKLQRNYCGYKNSRIFEEGLKDILCDLLSLSTHPFTSFYSHQFTITKSNKKCTNDHELFTSCHGVLSH
jgi:hypothetical protein